MAAALSSPSMIFSSVASVWPPGVDEAGGVCAATLTGMSATGAGEPGAAAAVGEGRAEGRGEGGADGASAGATGSGAGVAVGAGAGMEAGSAGAGPGREVPARGPAASMTGAAEG